MTRAQQTAVQDELPARHVELDGATVLAEAIESHSHRAPE
jgi:hypothetical protein